MSTNIGESYMVALEAQRMQEELESLRRWKSEALQVESEWDEQKLAKLLGGALGQSCRKIIAERVPEILSENQVLRELLKGQVKVMQRFKEFGFASKKSLIDSRMFDVGAMAERALVGYTGDTTDAAIEAAIAARKENT